MDAERASAALEWISVLHNPSSNNEERFKAQQNLLSLENDPLSPLYGYELAVCVEENMPDTVRHFGLHLLQQSVVHQWTNGLDDPRRKQIIEWCVHLSLGTSNTFKIKYVRNKLASVITCLAEREWLSLWPDFTDFLMQLYVRSDTHKSLALAVMQTILEDVFTVDDSIAGLRHGILSSALLSIFCPDDSSASENIELLKENIVPKNFSGWLCIIVDDFRKSSAIDRQLEILDVIKVALNYMLPNAILNSDVFGLLCKTLIQQNSQVQSITLDCLYILIQRIVSKQDPLWSIMESLTSIETLSDLRRLFQYQRNIIKDFDDTSSLESYTVLKKFAETIMSLDRKLFTDSDESNQHKDAEKGLFFEIATDLIDQPSLVVASITQPFFTRFLRTGKVQYLNNHQDLLLRLFAVAVKRLYKFEALTSDENSNRAEIMQYLKEDIESETELQSFLLNFRRFMADNIKLITFSIPIPVLSSMDQRCDQFFQNIYALKQQLAQKQLMEHENEFFLEFDAFIVLLDSVLQGIDRLLSGVGDSMTTDLEGIDRKAIIGRIQPWCSKVVDCDFMDSIVESRRVSILASFAMLFGEYGKDQVLSILRHLINIVHSNFDDFKTLENSEKIRELKSWTGHELMKLANKIPDQLMENYKSISDHFSTLLKNNQDENENIVLRSFLLIISQKSHIAKDQKLASFNEVVYPVASYWNSSSVQDVFNSEESFSNMLGMSLILDYLSSRNIKIDSPSLERFKLDEDGLKLQEILKVQRSTLWPVRAFRRFAEITLEAENEFDVEYFDLNQTWQGLIPQILPTLFSAIRRISNFIDLRSKGRLPPDLVMFMSEANNERFWLKGVSQLSRKQFMDQFIKSSNTVRELAHGLGHYIRRNREGCLALLGTLSNLQGAFYTIPNLASAIFEILLENVSGYSLHTWSLVIQLALRPIIHNCDGKNRREYYVVLLSPFLSLIRSLLDEEWASLSPSSDSDIDYQNMDFIEVDLTEEMKRECLLRHLSFHTARVLQQVVLTSALDNDGKTAEMLVLSEKDLWTKFVSLLLFLLHLRDQRSHSLALNVVKSMIPVIGSSVHLHPELENGIYSECFRTILVCVQEDYFDFSHSDLTNTLVLLYNTAKSRNSSACRNVLMSAPRVCSHPDLLEKFTEEMDSTMNKRTQKSLMWRFICSLGAKDEHKRDRIERLKKLVVDVDSKQVLKRFQTSMQICEDSANGSENQVLNDERDLGLEKLFSIAE